MSLLFNPQKSYRHPAPRAPSRSSRRIRRLGDTCCKDTNKMWNKHLFDWKICKKESNYLEWNRNMLIFAASKGEFAERMTTFMTCKGRFEPQNITSHHSPKWWLCCLSSRSYLECVSYIMCKGMNFNRNKGM